MEYGTQSAPVRCGNCGEATEGRYCRMCGMPVGSFDAPATVAHAAHSGYAAHGATQLATPMTGESTQAMPAVSDYGPEPTQVVGTLPTAPTQPPAEFDSLFRTADGSPGVHGQTQMLPPVVETDYRMEPPSGGRVPPGTPGGGHAHQDDEPGTDRRVVFVVLGAVGVAAAVILGLLYLGGQGSSSTGASGSTTTQAATGASQAPGVITVPTNGATVAPTTAAPTTPQTTAAAPYHGDGFPLGPGSSGSWVKWVQEKLKDLGYYDGSANGDYTQATELGVAQFQVAAGVVGDPTGVVGTHTRLALTAAGSTPGLKPGTKSAAVSRLNESLKLAEGADLSGSRYTTQTAIAVARYQAAVGLTPTGQVDATTWARLQAGTLG